MQLRYSQIIEKFGQHLGVDKSFVEDVFNKPDKTDIIGGTYISVKFYNGCLVLITFYTKGTDIYFENAYKIFPSMISVDVAKASAIDILKDFMENFGTEVDVPGIGMHKIYIDEKRKLFFQGILDLRKYAEAGIGLKK